MGGKLALLGSDLVDLLEVLEVSDVQPRDQGDRHPGLARATGAAGAVQVDLGSLRRGIAHHVGQIADIDSPGGDIRGDENAKLPRFDPRHRSLARPLAQIAADLVRVEAVALQEGRHVAHVVLGVAEDDGALGILGFEDPSQVLFFLVGAGDVEDVLDLRRRGVAVDQRDELGLVEEGSGKSQHLLGHRRREQTGLTFVGEIATDLPHIGPETQTQHFIGFVEDHVTDLPQG